ncbi:type VI immunity family protein [Myxococcus sp. AM009]|uniref:type VI immunity family protein n=1 Tax=Myxococcus sp. AM009 TaxID=2745137 RepID=UPI0020CD31C9|nr:type VI immunity family protein [Myxococcus sp. AM009]
MRRAGSTSGTTSRPTTGPWSGSRAPPTKSRSTPSSITGYPGLDIIDLGELSWKLGTRVRGPSWLTFLGQPVLDELNGATGLQTRLSAAGTTVQSLDDNRAVVTLGEWPEAGDMDQGDRLPAYRELARALAPWTYREEHLRGLGAEAQRRWERRFLD